MHLIQLAHLKSLVMVLTAAAGTVAGGTMINSYVNPGSTVSFLLSLNPSMMVMDQGGSSTSTVTVTSLNGYSGTVSLSLFYPSQHLNASLNPVSMSVPANGAAKSSLTVNAPTTSGNYTLVVIGLAGSHGKTSWASSMLTVQVQSKTDFTISANPSSMIGLAGSTNTTSISVSSLNGFSGTVSLTVTAPFGFITVTGGQNPLTLSSGGTASSTLTISTSPLNTIPGTYTLIVMGTSGSHTHKTMISLTVENNIPPPPVVESLVLNGFTFVNGTALMLNLQNTGNSTITLTSYIVKDSTGDAWSLTSWAGPIIAPRTSSTALILIGSSCPGCIYTGIAGLFLQFNVGQSYTVVVTTARNNQFSFTVTR